MFKGGDNLSGPIFLGEIKVLRLSAGNCSVKSEESKYQESGAEPSVSGMYGDMDW